MPHLGKRFTGELSIVWELTYLMATLCLNILDQDLLREQAYIDISSLYTNNLAQLTIVKSQESATSLEMTEEISKQGILLQDTFHLGNPIAGNFYQAEYVICCYMKMVSGWYYCIRSLFTMSMISY
jgi:hypothetical protein